MGKAGADQNCYALAGGTPGWPIDRAHLCARSLKQLVGARKCDNRPRREPRWLGSAICTIEQWRAIAQQQRDEVDARLVEQACPQ
jgi:hypothetical protein